MTTAPRDDGVALLSAVITVAIFGLIAIYLSLSATTEVRISDNYEALIQARYAALAGAAHARGVLRGLEFDDLLAGPDGTHSTAPDYVAAARTFAFRNPFEWSLARFVDCTSPAADTIGRPDDGLINTGACDGIAGTALIPLTGVGFETSGSGGLSAVRTRYFVKISDNNGESSETAADPADNPFHDGDGVILARSMGMAATLREKTGTTVRRNAVAVFESRYKRRSTFQLSAPLVILGDSVLPARTGLFEGTGFHLRGGAAAPGLAVIDPNPGNASFPAQQIAQALSPDQAGSITGDGSPPCIRDITSSLAAAGDAALLLSPSYLQEFINRTEPQSADNVLGDGQNWTGAGVTDLGFYDPGRPPNAPGQRPLATVVTSDLDIPGNVSGGGLLVVCGRMRVTGTFVFSGLVLVVGSGELDLRPVNMSVTGAIFLAAVSASNGSLSWGIPKITLGGNIQLELNVSAVRMGVKLIPPAQTGFREVTSTLDPNP